MSNLNDDGSVHQDLTHIVIAVKIDCHIPSETKVESFGPYTHEEADQVALQLADQLPVEWRFYSQQTQGDNIPLEDAVNFLLNV